VTTEAALVALRQVEASAALVKETDLLAPSIREVMAILQIVLTKVSMAQTQY
jgi:hypothetical protein